MVLCVRAITATSSDQRQPSTSPPLNKILSSNPNVTMTANAVEVGFIFYLLIKISTIIVLTLTFVSVLECDGYIPTVKSKQPPRALKHCVSFR